MKTVKMCGHEVRLDLLPTGARLQLTESSRSVLIPWPVLFFMMLHGLREGRVDARFKEEKSYEN